MLIRSATSVMHFHGQRLSAAPAGRKVFLLVSALAAVGSAAAGAAAVGAAAAGAGAAPATGAAAATAAAAGCPPLLVYAEREQPGSLVLHSWGHPCPCTAPSGLS